ncbi:hypothetical protein YPPY52_3755, partial [Yersinia pestis PY-52]
MYYFGRRRR